MYDLWKTCSICGERHMGYHYCKPKYISDYDRGFDDGKRSVPGYKPLPDYRKVCSLCGEKYLGVHLCPELLKSDYDKGYEAGRKKARQELGSPGENRLFFAGF